MREVAATARAGARQASISEMSDPELDQYIQNVRRDWGNVGMAVAVVADECVSYVRGFGMRQLGEPAEIDSDTLFQVGSTTKAFTAAALGLLVEAGAISWDTRAIDCLPGFELHDPALTYQVTLRDMLAHRTGISYNYYPFVCVMNAEEALRQLRYVPPEAPFRGSHVYSNLMYAAAGKIVEAVAGASWQQFVKQRLLDPLLMKRSGTSPGDYWSADHVAPTFLGTAPAGPPYAGDARDRNVAMPHVVDHQGAIAVVPWQSYDNAAAAGSIVSSAADMANWLLFNLNSGRFGGRQLLSAHTLQQLHAPQNSGPAQFPFDSTHYAMGWARAQYRDYTHLAHGGGMIGFPAYVALLPERRIGVAVLSNGPRERREEYLFHKAIACWVFDRLLGVPARDWNRECRARALQLAREDAEQEADLLERRARSASAGLPLDHYAGVYRDADGCAGEVTISLEHAELVLRFAGSGAFCARLEHWGCETFRLRPPPAAAAVLGPTFAQFAIDRSGRVESMSVLGATLRRAGMGRQIV